MGRLVVDETGLTGAFEIKTAFNPQSGDGRFPILVGAGCNGRTGRDVGHPAVSLRVRCNSVESFRR